MADAIRQFLTFEQRLGLEDGAENSACDGEGSKREQYFAALEMLRAHLHRCLLQVGTVGGVQIPKIADNMRYNDVWQLEAYVEPDALGNDTKYYHEHR